MKNILHYIKTGETPSFTSLTEANEFANFATKNLLTGTGDTIRERATLEMIHATQLEGKHDWDGYKGKKNKIDIEVKNETQKQNGNYTGSGIFNNITWRSFAKYEKGGLYVHGAYNRSGVLEFIVAFRIEHILPKLRAALKKKLPNGDVKGKNVTVNITSSDFPLDIEVCYVKENINIIEYSSRLLMLISAGLHNKTKVHGKRYLSSNPPKKKVTRKVRPSHFTDAQYLNRAKYVYGLDVGSIQIIDDEIIVLNYYSKIIKRIKTKSLNSMFNKKRKEK